MFVLNLLFNFNDDTGLFMDFEGGTNLLKSEHWLKLRPPGLPDPPPGFNPEIDAQWEDLGPSGTLHIPHGGAAPNRHSIAFRIAPAPAFPIAANATLDIAVAFGRPIIAQQPSASPFLDAANAAITFFQQTGLVRPAGVPAWFFRLPRIDRAPVPPHPNLTNRYEFALGVNVGSGGVHRTYGEDPEFDVGT